MRKKKLLSMMMALAMVFGIAAPSFTAKAESLTQEKDPAKVHYGTISESDIAILKDFFDAEYYLSENPELGELIGNDYDKLFQHFCLRGVFEGRSCNPNFDPSAYAAAYSDLKELFGSDILKYYEHFAKFGATDNRTLTTMEACANAGITVRPLTNPEIEITPQVYRVSKGFGTTNINSLKALATAVQHGNDNGGSVVIVESADEVMAEAQGLEKVGEIKVADGDGNYIEYTLFIAKGKEGYAAYKAEKNEKYVQSETNTEPYYKPIYVDSVPVYTTADFVARDKVAPSEYYDNSWENEIRDYRQLNLYFNYPNGYTPTEKDLDMTDEPVYNYTVDGDYTEIPSDGVRISSGQGGSSWWYSDENNEHVKYTKKQDIKDQHATAYYHVNGQLVGYYTNNEGDIYYFQNEKEKYDYIDRTTEVGDGYRSWHSDKYEYTEFHDNKGNADTVYDIGLQITPGEGDNFTVEVGVSNKDNNFGYIGEIEYTTTREVETSTNYDNSSSADTDSEIQETEENTSSNE